MYLIDTHCHIDANDFDQDREQVLTTARSVGVHGIVVPAINADGWHNLLNICATAVNLYPALGLHPVYLEQHRLSHMETLEQLLTIHKVVAIGEIGLDYWNKDLDCQLQQQFFEIQLAIAIHKQLPVLLHVRKAHDQALLILRRIRVCGGIVHAFNGSVSQAYSYIDLGFKLGFGGMLTFERSRKLRNLAKILPKNALVLETDAPDLTVASHRGERNSPAYLPECLIALAQVRGEEFAMVAEYTTHNVLEVLKLH